MAAAPREEGGLKSSRVGRLGPGSSEEQPALCVQDQQSASPEEHSRGGPTLARQCPQDAPACSLGCAGASQGVSLFLLWVAILKSPASSINSICLEKRQGLSVTTQNANQNDQEIWPQDVCYPKADDNKCWRDCGKESPLGEWWECQRSPTALDCNAIPEGIRTVLIHDPTAGQVQRKGHWHIEGTPNSMSIAAPLTVAQMWHRPRCAPAEQW